MVHSTISIDVNQLEELLKNENSSNITLKEVMYIRKLKIEGNTPADIAQKLSIKQEVLLKLFNIITF